MTICDICGASAHRVTLTLASDRFPGSMRIGRDLCDLHAETVRTRIREIFERMAEVKR